MIKSYFALIFCILISVFYTAQIGIGTSKLDPSTILNVSSGLHDKISQEAILTPIINSDGGIAEIIINNSGKGYSDEVQICIYGDGIGATASATVTDGTIQSITIDNLGLNYTEANAIVIPQSQAMLLSRINLLDVYDTTSPVNNPKDGLFVYNQDPTQVKKGLFYFDQSIPAWNRGLIYPETPKTFFIQFDSSTVVGDTILNNALNGATIPLGDPNFIYSDYTFGRVAINNGVRLVEIDDLYYLSMEPGKYLFELSFAFQALTPNYPPNSTGLLGSSQYQYNGLLYDMYYYGFDPNTETIGDCIFVSPSNPTCRHRKEAGTLVKAGEYFRYTQYFAVELPVHPDIPNYRYIINPKIGRMTGSSVLDANLFNRAQSYIKVLKY